MKLKENLITDWEFLMSGIKQFAQKMPNAKVKVNPDKRILINKYSVICHFINNEYVEVKVSHNDDDFLTVRHVKDYSSTINIVLNFINLNPL